MKVKYVLVPLLSLAAACEDVPADSGDTDDGGIVGQTQAITLANDCGDSDIPLAVAGPITTSTADLADEFGPGAGGCGPLDLPGQDGTFRVSVPANATLDITAEFADQRNASIFVASACEDDGCLAHGDDGHVTYENTGATAEFLVIVDSTTAGGAELSITVSIE